MRVAGWFIFLAVCAAALVRALTAISPPIVARADTALRAFALEDLVSREADSRKSAAKHFPTEPWSQDDFFHATESKEAHAFARAHSVPVTDILDALDEGLRARRSQGDRSIVSTVPPCHPRAIY
jgi:hypothetical protein